MTTSRAGRSAPRLDRWFLALLTAMPLVVYILYASWVDPIDEYYANYDPEFPYLLNSLEVFQGKPYFYTDHPGTPLEVIGTGIYGVTYLFLARPIDDFIAYHLRHPGLFLNLAHGFLLAASIATAWFFASAVSSGQAMERILLPVALAWMYFVVHPLAFPALTLWSHNVFSFAFGTLLLVVLFRLVVRRPAGEEIPRWRLAAIGAATGLLVAVTIYMAAWTATVVAVILLFYCFQGLAWSRTLAAVLTVALASAVGFILGVLPAVGRMAIFFDWIESLLTHRSPYLLGAADQPNIARWAANLVELCRQLPVLCAAVAGLLVLVAIAFAKWRKRVREAPGLWAMALGLVLQILLLTAFILDHPKSEYMLSVAAVVPVLTAVILMIFEYHPKISHILNRSLTALLLVGLMVALGTALQRHRTKALTIRRAEHQTRLAIEAHAGALGKNSADVSTVWTYGTYAPCFSLWFGNDSTGNAFRREIGQICPRDYELDVWSQRVVPSRGSGLLADTPWDMIIGCADAFKIAALEHVTRVQVFPDLQLSCGSLTIGYRAY